MEMMDIVNEADEVVGQASREEIYAKKLLHRIAHVLLFNDAGEMALQLRSKTVSFCPGHWSNAAGGHVQAGETFAAAAARELLEEIGIVVPFEKEYHDFYVPASGLGPSKFLGTFRAIYNGPFEADTEVVDKVEFFTLNQIRQMIAAGEKFHPEFLFLLEKHFDIL